MNGYDHGPNAIYEKSFIEWSVKEFGEENAAKVQDKYMYSQYREKFYGKDNLAWARIEREVKDRFEPTLTKRLEENPPNPSGMMTEVEKA